MNPERRSRRESRVEAITARDLLSTDAYAFALKRSILATFDTRIANLSLSARSLRSS